MYPDLSYFLHDVFGTARDGWPSIVKTYGFFLALTFLVSAFILYRELKWFEGQGKMTGKIKEVVRGGAPQITDILSQAIFGFLLGFKVVHIALNFAAFQADPSGVLLSAQGNWLFGILGAVVLGGYQYWAIKKEQLDKPITERVMVMPHQRVGDLILVAAISGVLGAKVFSILEDPTPFFADPVGTFFSGSGLTIYGGLITATLVVVWYAKRQNLPILYLMNAAAPVVMIGYGVGRLGCHFSGDGDWGIENPHPLPSYLSFLPEWLWAYDYPHNINMDGVPIDGCTVKYCTHLDPKVYPTPIYETFMATILGGILMFMNRKFFIPGFVFGMYLVFTGTERFFIEKIRVNIRYDWLPGEPTQAEVISLIYILGGIAFMTWTYLRYKKSQTA